MIMIIGIWAAGLGSQATPAAIATVPTVPTVPAIESPAVPIPATPSVQQGIRLVTPTTTSGGPMGPASALARATPRDVHGIAKRDGLFEPIAAVALAKVKPDYSVYAAAKRVTPPPPSRPMPDWLWTAYRTSEADAVRKVPEVGLPAFKTRAELARQFKTVLKQHENGSDFFIDVVSQRPGIADLPFLKGKDCQLSPHEEATLRTNAAEIRQMLDIVELRAKTRGSADGLAPIPDRLDLSAAVPALMQILGPLSGKYRVALARKLEDAPKDQRLVDALVRLALFDPEADVRAAAVQSLRKKPADAYAPKLIEGFRHPAPYVAERAADALVALRCFDHLPGVVDFLDEPDPAAPFDREGAFTMQMAVREVVKVNHMRNCLLCHAPVALPREDSGGSSLMALLPSPDETPPSSSVAYYNDFRGGDMVVRVNEVYLRQDFSRLETVDKPGKWPAQQRFDYMVRTRNVDSVEAQQLRPKSAPKDGEAVPSPNHRAALSVLCRLTSMYLGTKSSDWRDEIARRVEESKDTPR